MTRRTGITRLSKWSFAIACVVAWTAGLPAASAEEVAPTQPAALGLSFSVMPVGKVSVSATSGAQTIDASADADTATAIAPFFDYALTPNLTLGFSPQVIFNVKASNGTAVREYDLRARVTARAPISPRMLVFGRLSPGYSIIDFPNAENPKGLLIDASIGLNGQILPNAFLGFDVGYQVGFQSFTEKTGLASTDFDFRTRYLHLGLSFGVTFGA